MKEFLTDFDTTPTIEYPVVWEFNKYKVIEKFDCHVVKLKHDPTYKGGYMTVIPISPKEYRDKHPTRAGVTITKHSSWTLFEIYSDHGKCSEMKIHNSLSKEIEIAILAAKEQELIN